MTTKYAHPTLGFGVPDTGGSTHHYLVNVPRNSIRAVTITEILAGSTETIDRVFIGRDRWKAISGAVQRAFNKRLKELNLAPWRWGPGNNPVDRLLGKELCVLAWAIEEASAEHIGLAVRKWLALKPEERWWLFGMAARDVRWTLDKPAGWRKALGVALTGARS